MLEADIDEAVRTRMDIAHRSKTRIMSIEDLARICVETFSREKNIPLSSIHIQKTEEHFIPHATPGPGQMGISSGTNTVRCTVTIPGGRYIITTPRNGHGKVQWKQI